jgi:hypothetical protein
VVNLPSASRTDGPPLQRRDGPRVSYVFFISDMPTFYIRKKSAPNRGEWTAENLQNAVNAVSTGAMGVNEAAKAFSIPKSTLLRRMKTNNLVKKHRLGPDSLSGEIAEKKLATRIKKLQRSGFAPTREKVRVMAYNLAAKLGIKHNFDNVKGKLIQ